MCWYRKTATRRASSNWFQRYELRWALFGSAGFDRLGVHDLLESFLSATHVSVVGPGERQDPVDAWLHSLGHKRNIALSVPTYLLALRMVATTDLVAVLPKLMMRHAGASIGVSAMKLPIDPGTDAMNLHFPAAAENDPASKWLRKQITECVS
jgi:DNA-binding transcriptional LysR family regulator